MLVAVAVAMLVAVAVVFLMAVALVPFVMMVMIFVYHGISRFLLQRYGAPRATGLQTPGGCTIFALMKRLILLLMAVLLGSLTAQAQSKYYLGGEVSLGASSSGTSVVVYPEIGRRITDHLYAGLAAGFDWNNLYSESDFTMGLTPHLRGYLPLYEGFGLSGDAFFSARWTRRKGYEPLIKTQRLGFRPGVFVPLGGVTLSAQVGFFGWTRTDYGNGSVNADWVARLEARDILIGVLVNL